MGWGNARGLCTPCTDAPAHSTRAHARMCATMRATYSSSIRAIQLCCATTLFFQKNRPFFLFNYFSVTFYCCISLLVQFLYAARHLNKLQPWQISIARVDHERLQVLEGECCQGSVLRQLVERQQRQARELPSCAGRAGLGRTGDGVVLSPFKAKNSQRQQGLLEQHVLWC